MYEFKEQDTTWLQLESIIKCAKSLGYTFDGRSFYKVFYIEKLKRTYTMYKSFNNMQYDHNCY
jgi:hypothetical protein